MAIYRKNIQNKAIYRCIQKGISLKSKYWMSARKYIDIYRKNVYKIITKNMAIYRW